MVQGFPTMLQRRWKRKLKGSISESVRVRMPGQGGVEQKKNRQRMSFTKRYVVVIR